MECNGCEIRPELYYDPDFQIWARREEDGNLTVGMTDYSQSIAGKILHARVRKAGTRRPPNKPIATLESGKWAGPVPNFFDCVIVEPNEEIMADPKLLNLEPYEAWIAVVEPVNGAETALEGMLTGDAAGEEFCRRAQEEGWECSRDVR